MQFTVWLSIVCLFFMTNCQLVTGQEISEGNINIIIDKEIVFFDPNVDAIINAYAIASVTFKESFILKPINTSISMIKMSEICRNSKESKVNFMFVSVGSRENNLNTYEKVLLEKYLPKVDSIFMNSRYEFIGERKWIDARKMDIGIPFKIKPE